MISVIGLGPGSRKYILPAAIEVIQGADLVIGGKRNLDSIEEYCSKRMDLSVGFDPVAAYLKEHKARSIAVVVSGDTGFYSMLSFVKRHVDESWIEVIPGISSLQYMFGRLKKSYENTPWISLHGRNTDLVPYIKGRKSVGILTDKVQNNQYIAGCLKEAGVENAVLYVGEKLSYPDERITRMTVDEGVSFEADDLSVVVIDYE